MFLNQIAYLKNFFGKKLNANKGIYSLIFKSPFHFVEDHVWHLKEKNLLDHEIKNKFKIPNLTTDI